MAAGLSFVMAFPAMVFAQQAMCYASLETYVQDRQLNATWLSDRSGVVMKSGGTDYICRCASATSKPECKPRDSSGAGGSSGSSLADGLGVLDLSRFKPEQQVALVAAQSVIQSFFQMLFSDDSKADAQKQQMMAELAQRKAEAERQNRVAQAQRLAATYSRLQNTLKLSGLPTLGLKGDGEPGAGGLQLKLGDSSDRVGIPGLPGIALNDNTGKGGSTPYGIPGLPGIYINGPATPPTPASGGGLPLKIGEAGTSTTPPASTARAPADGATPANPVTDARNMTPQQLADLATQINDLPPEEQQRLMDAARSATQGAPPATSNTPPAQLAPGQPTQLQQIAGASQSAAGARGLEDAAARARQGFDTPIGGVAPPGVAISGTKVAPVLDPAVHQPGAASGAPQSPARSVSVPPAQVTSAASPSGGNAPGAAAVPATNPSGTTSAPCPPGIEKLIPPRPRLETELAVRHAQLESLRTSIMRLNRTIQLDQGQLAVWEDEASNAIKRLNTRIFDLAAKAMLDAFVETNEDYFKTASMPEDERAAMLGKLAAFKNIKDFDDFCKFALEAKGDWRTIEEGVRQFLNLAPLVKDSPVVREMLFYVSCGEALIDNAYDYVDFLAIWNNVQQLDHNSTQFLDAVHRNGERIQGLVQRIQEIEAQLKATPVGPPNASPCRQVPASDR